MGLRVGIVFILFHSILCFSEPIERFQLQFQLYIDGIEKRVSDIEVQDGQTTRLIHKDPLGSVKTILEIKPLSTDIGFGEKLLLELNIKKEIAGQETLISSPKLVTRFGSPAEVNQTNEANQGLRLIIVPTRL